jgi:ABC-type transport system substrate-binding protein
MKEIRVLNTLAAAALVLAACAAPTQAPADQATATPAAAEPTAGPTAQPTIAVGQLADVPRNQTVILGWSISAPIGVTNPWANPGYTHQELNNLLWEPLFYYGIFKSEPIPWLATSMEYTNDDFTQLEIKMNPAAKWSDGEAVDSADVVYTFNGQMTNEKLPYHTQFEQFVESVEAPDAQTVIVNFKIPAPRFAFEVLTLKFDTGIPIVPEHWLSQQADVNAAPGGIEIPTSGPYRLVLWDATQKIYDLRDDWWAIEAGIATVPDVKRVVVANIGGQVGQNMDTVAQRVVNNEFDATLDMRSATISNIVAQNQVVTTHSGSEPPYGYLDWWPNSLWMNTQIEPYSDARVRRAISLSIDRDTIDEVVYEGASVTTIYPFPLYPALDEFTQTPEVQALIEQYQPRAFDLEQSAALMEEAGFTRNGDGLWERDGQTVNATINGFEGIHADIVPVLVEMLRTGGFDAETNFGTDAYQNMADGAPGLYMFGHGASLVDPYAAFELFHSRYSAAIGTSAGNNRFSRYINPEYDAILDEMAALESSDPRFQELAVQALEIYWRDQIDVPIIQWLHRIPYNQTYWTNWPTASNPDRGENGAFWATTGMLVITGLKATGAP